MVDDEDYEFLMRFKWRYGGQSHKKYVIASGDRYNKSQVTFYMHTLILGGRHGDHADGNTLDNRKTNVRQCTRQENEWNKGKFKTIRGKQPSSQYKGVSKYGDRWVVLISKGKGKGVLRCGYYDTEIEAAKAYNKKIVELRGKFAWVNPIPLRTSNNTSTKEEV